MTQEKMRKLITAFVTAGTALLVFLLSVLVYQWITIGVNARREKKIRAEIASYEELLANAENDLAYYESDYYKWLESIKLESVEGNK
jgi:F0F1-type ATP synthase membrane subunit b/b'